MALFESGEVAEMRREEEEAMPDTATIQRPVITNGPGGQSAGSPTTTTLRVRLSRLGQSPAEQAVAERLGSVTLSKLVFPYGSDVKSTDTVLVGSRTFEVAAVLPVSSYSDSLQVIAQEVL